MTTNSLNSLSSTYLPPSDYAGQTGSNSTVNPQLSTFAQLLSSSASSSAGEATSSTSSPQQMLNQLMASFKTNGIQNEGQSFDPMTIG